MKLFALGGADSAAGAALVALVRAYTPAAAAAVAVAAAGAAVAAATACGMGAVCDWIGGDDVIGCATGCGLIFGGTGGVGATGTAGGAGGADGAGGTASSGKLI